MSGTIGSYGFSSPYGTAAQFAPQGLLGNILGGLAAPAGGALGNLFGQQQLGSQIGGVAGQLANMLPFAAGPQMAAPQPPQLAPQGLLGSILGAVAAPAG